MGALGSAWVVAPNTWGGVGEIRRYRLPFSNIMLPPPPLLPLPLAGAAAALVIAVIAAAVTSLHAAALVISPAGSTALLVISHPDDESMFMAPTLAALLAARVRVHVLCLSVGVDGPPHPRSRVDELRDALVVLRADPRALTVVDSPALRDGLHTAWPADEVARHVAAAVESTRAAAVVSFDAGGVTGHPNHVATAAGVALFAASRGAPPCFALESVAAARKFVGSVGDVATSALLLAGRWAWEAARHAAGGLPPGPRPVLLVSLDAATPHRALAAHASQRVWHRVLFQLGSRYTFVNTLVPLPRGGAAATAQAREAARRGR